jgi:hypothetical protein
MALSSRWLISWKIVTTWASSRASRKHSVRVAAVRVPATLNPFRKSVAPPLARFMQSRLEMNRRSIPLSNLALAFMLSLSAVAAAMYVIVAHAFR